MIWITTSWPTVTSQASMSYDNGFFDCYLILLLDYLVGPSSLLLPAKILWRNSTESNLFLYKFSKNRKKVHEHFSQRTCYWLNCSITFQHKRTRKQLSCILFWSWIWYRARQSSLWILLTSAISKWTFQPDLFSLKENSIWTYCEPWYLQQRIGRIELSINVSNEEKKTTSKYSSSSSLPFSA